MKGDQRGMIRLVALALGLVVAGAQVACSAVPPGFQRVRPTPLDVAAAPTSERSLLDVGVAVGDVQAFKEGELKKLGTNEDIRGFERYFVPYHLKQTLQMSNHWGMVRVVPDEYISDLRVSTRLYRSNGEKLQVRVVARDAMGRIWLDKRYHADASPASYQGTSTGSQEAFQDLYNTIANDLAAAAIARSSGEVDRIREVTGLRFAQEMAPEVFADYTEVDSDGRVSVLRLPSRDDSMAARIAKIRDRENLFIDTLDFYYDGFYRRMWTAYEDWRRLNLTERVALKQAKDEAFLRGLAGVLLIAAGVALGATTDSTAGGAAGGVLILAGGQVVIDGINVSQQANIHAEALEELGDSFGADMKPTFIELEGKLYELTGTLDEQFEEWRSILRRIYLEETGYLDDPDASGL